MKPCLWLSWRAFSIDRNHLVVTDDPFLRFHTKYQIVTSLVTNSHRSGRLTTCLSIVRRIS